MSQPDAEPSPSAEQTAAAEPTSIEIQVPAGRWRIRAVVDASGNRLFAADLTGDPTATSSARRLLWAKAQADPLRLEEELGWAIPHLAQNALVLAHLADDLPAWRNDHPGPLSDDAIHTPSYRPTRNSIVRGVPGSQASYGRLLHDDNPVRRWQQDPIEIDLFTAETEVGRAIVYRVSETVPGQQPALVFAGGLTGVPRHYDVTSDDTIRRSLAEVLTRALDDDEELAPRQQDFLLRHRRAIRRTIVDPPDHPLPRGTRITVAADDPARTDTGTILAVLDTDTGPSYLWRPDVANLPGHPWRDHPTWTLPAAPHQVQVTFANPDAQVEGPTAPPVLATGAVVATIDDPRFTTGTVLRALDHDGTGTAYEIQPHDAPLPPVTLPYDDVVPLRGTAWPNTATLLTARAAADLPTQPGEILLTVREIAIAVDSPDGTEVLTAPFTRRPITPALDPASDVTPAPVPAGLLQPVDPDGGPSPRGQLPALHQVGDTVLVDDPVHGRIQVHAETFHAAMRHPPDDLNALLARRPWLPTPSPDQPVFVTAALAAQHAAAEVASLDPPTTPRAPAFNPQPDLPGPGPDMDPGI
ncbi:hypothetical protein I6A60_19055 [Frankia sp. AgB1.9]|uniref:hypothetical protein n=1 Tax=unclassified Frankia TaxID=2632575 RepID=UPI0019337350|nr:MULTISPECIES: hypothetical protein [unclassified Frankia]MBL7487895.1 hypothetical protein [Frankia sp. AgW1.1]MBL7549960.1 hypothetical protein [Frankia sp. AgB1.9]MBL7621461.1 hypothetical protein [Frankia sp. AgB1.8]